MTRLIQIRNGDSRRVAVVEEPNVRLLDSFTSIYELASTALARGLNLPALIAQVSSNDVLDYDSIYAGVSPWRLMVPVDHPIEPSRCLVSGTGLTHLGSAKNRQAMHGVAAADETDSMKMFRWGVEGGRPDGGKIGTPPEWFYKGVGTILRAPGESLNVPPYADDGGEEAEIAGVYLIDAGGVPHRLGMAMGNEFSDHRFEKKNYLNLAGSKVRTCSLGPELVIDAEFKSVPGKAIIERGKEILWAKDIRTGEDEMCHSLRNIEHHHFKFETHQRPGDLHVHYYGACALSFGDGVELKNGDIMKVEFSGFGRALRNPVSVTTSPDHPITVRSLA